MRLFVAINLPADVRESIWEAAQPLRERNYPVRWVAPESQHVTMKFLGDIPEGRLGEIIEAVDASTTGAKPFTVPLADFGAFPAPSRPRVIWAGCEAVPPLELLQDQLERHMAALGFEIEGRPFRPHVTLGRVRRDARAADFAGFEALLDDLHFATESVVRSLDLMESHLAPSGARYEVRHAAELRAA